MKNSTDKIQYSDTSIVPEITLSNAIEVELLKYYNEDFKEFRKQYQPQSIACVFDAIENNKRYQFHIGCGGGKTAIFLTSILYNIIHGKISKVMLSAPRLALLSQHVFDLEKMIAFGKANNVIPQDFILDVVEISSRTVSENQLKKIQKLIIEEEMEDDAAIEVESEEQFQISENNGKEIVSAKHMNYVHTSNAHSKINHYLKSSKPIVFVGCIPSVLTVFVDKVKHLNIILDVLVNDEYHNLISQNKKKKPVEKLQELFNRFYTVLNFSATPKKGQLLSSSDAMFGTEIVKVATPDLKYFGYLKKHFKVFFIASGYTRSFSDNEKFLLESKKIVDIQQFYKEMSIILQVINKFLKDYPNKKPHIITATSRIAIIEEIYRNEEFKQELFKLIDKKTSVFNTVSGSTKSVDRDKIFKLLQKATKDVATLTMQHSVMSEGINVTNFSTCIIMRGMNEISMNQFINRITRKHDDYDTAEIYVQMDGNTSEQYKKFIKEFLQKLLYFGLTMDDIECELISLGTTGDDEPEEKTTYLSGQISFQKVTTSEQEIINDIKLDNQVFELRNKTPLKNMDEIRQFIFDNNL